VDAAEG